MLLYPERYFLVMLKYCAHFSGAACGDKHRVFDETCGLDCFAWVISVFHRVVWQFYYILPFKLQICGCYSFERNNEN